MADRTQKLTLLAQIDERAIRRSIELTRQFEKATDKATYSVDEEQQATQQLSRGLGQLSRGNATAVANIRQRVNALKAEHDAVAAQIGIEEKLDQTRRNARARAVPSVASGGQAGDLGKVERGVMSVGALVPGAGGDLLRGLGDIAGAADDIKPLISEIGKLAQAGPIAGAAMKLLGVNAAAAGTGAAGAAVSLGIVAAAALPVIAAIAAVTIAFQKFQKDLEQQKAVLEGAISSQRHYYEIIQTGTRESVQAELDAAQVRQQSAQQTRQDLLDAYNNLGLVGQALDSVGGATLKKNLEALDTEIQINADSINDLTKALTSNEVAARSVTKAQQDAADALLKETEGLVRANEMGATGTRKAAQDRIAAIQRETEVLKSQLDELEALAKTGSAGQEALAKVNARLADLAQEERLIKDVSLPLLNARKAETAAITQTTSALRESTAARQKDAMDTRRTLIGLRGKFNTDMAAMEKRLATDRIKVNADAAAKIAEIGKELTDSIAGLEREAAQAESAAQRQLDAQIAQISQEGADREISIVQETDNRIAELRERHKRDLARIENDYDLAARNARLNRDAVALDAAQRQREDATKEANTELKTAVKQERKAGKERLNEQRKADEQRIRDLRAAAAQETEERRITLQQRIVDLQAGSAAEIETIRIAKEEALRQLTDRFNQEKAQRQAQYSQEAAALLAHINELISINVQGLNTIAGAWQGFFNGLAGAVGGSSQGTSSGGVSVGSGGGLGGSRQGFASGVRNFSGGLAMVGERGPELAMLAKGTSIYSNEDTKRILGGMKGSTYNFTINTQSTDAKGILREVKRQMPAIMAQVIEDQL